MRLRAMLPALLVLAATGCAVAQQETPAERFERNVSWLADDARQGRQTGTDGLEAAADYVAASFDELGLEPGGDDGGWLQAFDAAGARILVDGNALTIAGQELALDDDWLPLASSAPATVAGPLVFAGYGITDPDGGYDDYENLDVEGKLVVVLRRGPGASRFALDSASADDADHADEPADDAADERNDDAGDPHAGPAHGAGGTDRGQRYHALTGRGRHLISFSSKVNTAYKAGAAGLLVINDPAGFPPGSEADAVGPFGATGRGGVASALPAVTLTAAAGGEVLASLGVDLAALQLAIDGAMTPRSFGLPEGEAALVVATERELVGTFNVVGILPGSDPARSHEHVLVGAHMDHLGLGLRSGSLGGPADAGKIHNGADDNASGTAGLIEVAALLSRRKLARSVVFVAFSAEEWGLLGSRHYVEDPVYPLDDMLGMVNMDMIGRSGGAVSISGTGTAADNKMLRLVDDAHETLDVALEVQTAPSVPGNSDHAPFYEKQIPVLNFFTGLHDDYHRPTDDMDKIDVENGASIARLAAECATLLARLDERLVFADPDAEQRAVAAAEPHGTPSGDQGQVVGYGVVFGSQPDMTYQADDGVRVSGTRAGTPAEACGLQQGDVITALDGKPVRNLEDYSVLLFSHRPGDEISISVRRGDEQVELTAVLEGRRGDG